MKKIIAIILCAIIVSATPASALAMKSATIEPLDEQWDTEDEKYTTVSTQEGFAFTMEGKGWWILRPTVTFIPSEDGIQYETGWWIFKETGTLEAVETEDSNSTLYEDYNLYHCKVDDKHVQFFQLTFNSSWNWSLDNDSNVTLYFFGQDINNSDSVMGVMYESDISIITHREPTISDMTKYSQYMRD